MNGNIGAQAVYGGATYGCVQRVQAEIGYAQKRGIAWWAPSRDSMYLDCGGDVFPPPAVPTLASKSCIARSSPLSSCLSSTNTSVKKMFVLA